MPRYARQRYPFVEEMVKFQPEKANRALMQESLALFVWVFLCVFCATIGLGTVMALWSWFRG